MRLRDYDAAYRLAYCRWVKYGKLSDLQTMLGFVVLWADNKPPSEEYVRAYCYGA